jgi:prepilin-type N-terminal cleavage/methylation domain-containing protein
MKGKFKKMQSQHITGLVQNLQIQLLHLTDPSRVKRVEKELQEAMHAASQRGLKFLSVPRRSEGFTLMELAVVIGIFSVVLSVLVILIAGILVLVRVLHG